MGLAQLLLWTNEVISKVVGQAKYFLKNQDEYQLTY
jgi:hypothetical protein